MKSADILQLRGLARDNFNIGRDTREETSLKGKEKENVSTFKKKIELSSPSGDLIEMQENTETKFLQEGDLLNDLVHISKTEPRG